MQAPLGTTILTWSQVNPMKELELLLRKPESTLAVLIEHASAANVIAPVLPGRKLVLSGCQPRGEGGIAYITHHLDKEVNLILPMILYSEGRGVQKLQISHHRCRKPQML
eukprot:1160120-Pelagomonas_calceolata.AAC.1